MYNVNSTVSNTVLFFTLQLQGFTKMQNAQTDLQTIQAELVRVSAKLENILPSNIGTDKFISIALASLNSCPAILQCSKLNIINVIMQSARDGLLPDGREAVLIAYKGVVKYMPMYQGIIKKMYESGLEELTSHVVYSNDIFKHVLGDSESIEHEPAPLNTERGDILAVYCIAKTKDAVFREVLRVAEITKIREAGNGGNSGAWRDWWTEMAKKTVIRRLAKKFPLTAELSAILQSDDESSDIQFANRRQNVVSESKKTLTNLRAKMEENSGNIVAD